MGVYDRLLYEVEGSFLDLLFEIVNYGSTTMGKKDPLSFLDEMLGPLIQPPKSVKKPKPIKKPKEK